MTETSASANRGWLFYDGECSLCTGAAMRFQSLLNHYGFEMAPLQTAWARERLSSEADEVPDEMKLLTDARQIFGGADALLQIARRIWWTWPIFALAKIPGITPLFRVTYRWLAANRTCFGGKCLIPENHYPQTKLD
jgi:predicted DCC family thiol-disulfide oxidoreductase YuxK